MKKIFFIICLVMLTSSTTEFVQLTSNQDVFICDSRTGKKYHFTKTCRRLNACKAPIKKLSLESAKKIGKTLCGWEN